jgi:hypothetical protein
MGKHTRFQWDIHCHKGLFKGILIPVIVIDK